MLGGGLLLVLLAAAAVLLPALLLPTWDPVAMPRAPLDAPGTRNDAQASLSPAEAQPPEAMPPTEYTGPDTPPTPTAGSLPQTQPADRTALPIVERRRVQRGQAPPQSRPAAQLPKPTRENEWDRSSEARRRGVDAFGGTPRTETAVEAGLAWLAAHQSPDGIWDRFHFNRQCPAGDECPGVAVERTDYNLDPGVTGLALLAFLGAGYTDQQGPYQDVVRAAVDALLRLQEPHGGFSRAEGMAGYNDSLATLALAEYYALAGAARVREPLERAVARLTVSQQPLGGWDYVRRPGSGRDDTSITAWMVQALHACAAAGIEVPPGTLVRAALHFTRATEADGRVRYSDSGSGFKLNDNLRPVYRYGIAMTAAGLMCEQMLGWRLDGAVPLRQRALLLANPPSATKARRDPLSFHGDYYWYYGTLAMFQRGGEDWERWNARLRDAIMPLQNRKKTGGRKSHAFGSWPPFGTTWGLWGKMGSRTYSTAICTLTLEIYYRHTPAFLKEEMYFSAEDWRAYLKDVSARERRVALACLAQLRVEVAEPVLVELLAHSDRRIALAAAEALAGIDSPLGVTLIEAVITTLPPWERSSLERALERGKAVAALPPADGRVRLCDPATGLATLDLPRSYVGMMVNIWRDGRSIARMRVIQRFTGRTVVVAELVEVEDHSAPEPGDRALGR